MLRFFFISFTIFVINCSLPVESLGNSSDQIQPLKRTYLRQLNGGQYYLCVDFDEDVKIFPRIHIADSSINVILSFNKSIVAPPSKPIDHRVVRSIRFEKFGPSSLMMTINLRHQLTVSSKRYTQHALTIGFKIHKKPMIVIDPGHGDRDLGTHSITGSYEKNVTLVMAVELMQILLDSGRYNVSLTRDKDRSISLKERKRTMRVKRGDLLISLHADGGNNAESRGISVHTLPDLKFSEKFTKASNIDEAKYRKNLRTSRKFAETLVGYIPNVCKLHRQMCGNSNLKILEVDKPAVLIECGNLSNKRDNNLLHLKKFRDRTNKAILYALDEFFKRENK
ncbi:MAG: N-acetylmuramoyl-L-alanine amidase [Holosporaceae bacterium]|jgi:N-acetylmuramoyl-L-alanine amidase|nr:N-acetylmuramoyl-L-alanine amidase [Holosporaceae bacterium]